MTDWGAWSREAVALMNARNEEWNARFGLARAPYRWDLERGRIRFDRAGDRVVADLCLIGTASMSEGTFQWAWADPTVPGIATAGLDLVRRFGEEHDLSLLITPEWPGGRSEALEMLAVAGRIQDAEGAFVDQTDDLTLCFTLRNFRQVTDDTREDP
jgi:hypothetical protein